MHVCSPEPKFVFDNPVAFYTPNNMFNTHTYLIDPSILFLFFGGQLAASRLFLRLYHDDTTQRKALKPHILVQDTVFWKGVAFIVSQTLIVPLSFIRCSQTPNTAGAINDDNIFYRMLLLLSTIVQALFIRVIWSIYWSFRTVMEEKGDVSAGLTSLPPISAVAMTISRWGNEP